MAALFIVLLSSIQAMAGAADDEYLKFIAGGDSREKKSDYDGAIAEYTHAIELDKLNAKAYYLRGIAKRRKVIRTPPS
jgi:hypothetical protein